MLFAIERATRKRIDQMELPSTEIINDKRIARFKQRISEAIAGEDLEFYTRMVEQYCQEHDVSELEAAAALAKLLQGDTPFLLSSKPEKYPSEREPRRESSRGDSYRDERRHQEPRKPRGNSGLYSDEKKETYRIEVGSVHDVKPGNIAGAIINEIGLDPEAIGRITINDQYSTVELPADIPNDVFQELKKVRVCGRQLRASKSDEREGGSYGDRGGNRSYGGDRGGDRGGHSSYGGGNRSYGGDRSGSDRSSSDRGNDRGGYGGDKKKSFKKGPGGPGGKTKRDTPFFTGFSATKKKRMKD